LAGEGQSESDGGSERMGRMECEHCKHDSRLCFPLSRVWREESSAAPSSLVGAKGVFDAPISAETEVSATPS
jgi:hypothetical protein